MIQSRVPQCIFNLPLLHPIKKKKKVTSTIVNNILGEEEKTLNYGHRTNELKHKVKMFYIHRAIFHTAVKQKFLVDVYTRTWRKIPDIKLLELRLELRGPPTSEYILQLKSIGMFFFNKYSSFNNYVSFLIKTIKVW